MMCCFQSLMNPLPCWLTPPHYNSQGAFLYQTPVWIRFGWIHSSRCSQVSWILYSSVHISATKAHGYCSIQRLKWWMRVVTWCSFLRLISNLKWFLPENHVRRPLITIFWLVKTGEVIWCCLILSCDNPSLNLTSCLCDSEDDDIDPTCFPIRPVT